MKESQPNFKHFLHPYIFILKEGKQINENFLDYSLLLLQVAQVDILRSPKKSPEISNSSKHLLNKLK